MSEEAIFQQLEICQKQRDNALSQIAALREELDELEEEYDTLEHANITLKQRLADAQLSPDHSGGGAGMVLPEKFPLHDDMDFFDKGWNAAIERVKELNQ